MEGKKSFILYADLISIVEKLDDKQAGQLFKIILHYVNDKDPKVDDLLLQIAFEPIKNQLKRDLNNWNDIRQKRSEAGKKSAEAREARQHKATNPTSVKFDEQKATNPTVNVTVTDTVTDNANDNDIQGVCENLQKFFGYESEIKYLDKQKDIFSFACKLKVDGKMERFKEQFNFYTKYKKLNGQQTHGFRSFLDGGWDSDNWKKKFLDANKTVQGW